MKTIGTFLLFVTLITSVFSSQKIEDNLDAILANFQTNGTENFAVVPSMNIDIISLLRIVARSEILKFNNEKSPQENQTPRYTTDTNDAFSLTNMNIIKLGNKTYFFSNKQGLLYMDAVWFCRLYGMEIASVKTKEENDLIANHINVLGGKTIPYYISANKIGRSTFMWINGDPIIYENWGAGEPRAFVTEHCMAYYNSQWADTLCTNTYSFICEA